MICQGGPHCRLEQCIFAHDTKELKRLNEQLKQTRRDNFKGDQTVSCYNCSVFTLDISGMKPVTVGFKYISIYNLMMLMSINTVYLYEVLGAIFSFNLIRYGCLSKSSCDTHCTASASSASVSCSVLALGQLSNSSQTMNIVYQEGLTIHS